MQSRLAHSLPVPCLSLPKATVTGIHPNALRRPRLQEFTLMPNFDLHLLFVVLGIESRALHCTWATPCPRSILLTTNLDPWLTGRGSRRDMSGSKSSCHFLILNICLGTEIWHSFGWFPLGKEWVLSFSVCTYLWETDHSRVSAVDCGTPSSLPLVVATSLVWGFFFSRSHHAISSA
jgi:hypothetical protein